MRKHKLESLDCEKELLEICENYESSPFYALIKERIEYLVLNADDKQKMIDYLKDSADEYIDNPKMMLGFLNLMKKFYGNPYSKELQIRNSNI